ncbi:hypothetical protein [Eisenibacter elegans]|uniref:hypothetical protein n=1 Tax=Eisenibacter elegans TaxID=997 RepID=UPI0003F75368|nr:hypothetical protein [Eisenibacter elegans]
MAFVTQSVLFKNNPKLGSQTIEQRILAGEKEAKGDFNFFKISASKALFLRNQGIRSKAAMCDSMGVSPSVINQLLVGQALRLASATPKELLTSVINKGSVMMFFLIPIFAFLLQMSYSRVRCYYVEHLILVLHLHSYLFLMVGLTFWINHWFTGWWLVTTVLLSSVIWYVYRGFRVFYGQSRWWTIFRLWWLSNLYGFTLMMGIVLLVALGLLFF